MGEIGKSIEIAEFKKKCREYVEKQDYLKAIEMYTEIINSKADEAILYFERGNLYCLLAESCEKKAGEVWRNGERYNNAIKDYTKAIMLDSKNKEYYIMRGNIYTNIFEEDKLALKDYLYAYKIDKEDADVCVKIGDMYGLIDDLNNALKYYKLALEIDSENEYALYSIASIYDINDEVEEAIKYYTEFIKYNNTNTEVYCDRANCYYKQESYHKALEDLEYFAKLKGCNTERSFNLRGKVFEKLKKEQEALLEYKKAADRIKKETNECEIVKNIDGKSDMDVLTNKIKKEELIKGITEFEKSIGIDLPEDYKNFIINNNDKELEHVKFKTRDGFIKSSILRILSIQGENTTDLYEEYKVLNSGNKIPKTLIAIAIDPAQTPICICIKGKNKGKVYYWMRDFESDNYKPSYKNMHIIADSFQEFINILY